MEGRLAWVWALLLGVPFDLGVLGEDVALGVVVAGGFASGLGVAGAAYGL